MNSSTKVPWRSGAVGAALATLLGWLMLTPLGDWATNLSYELPFFFRPDIHPTEATILYMDKDSHQYLNQPWFKAWDRSIHVRALERLMELGAKAVVFDVLFAETSTNVLPVVVDGTNSFESADKRLVEAAQKYGRVFFVAQSQADEVGGRVIGANITRPFSPLLQSGIAETTDAANFVRQHYRDNAAHDTTVAWNVVQGTMAHPPTDPLRPRWMNYYGPPSIIPSYSYYHVVSNSISPSKPIPIDAISNKVVFIGALYSAGFTGGIGTDDLRTPYTLWTGRKSPGVEVTATAYLNLLRGDWLIEMPPLVELLLITVSGALFGFGFGSLPPLRATPLAAIIAVLISVGAIFLMWQRLIWFPWLIPVAVQAPVALFWSVLVHTKRLRQEKQQLEMQLAAAQLRTAAAPNIDPISTIVDGAPTQPTPAIPDHTLIRIIGEGAYGEVWLAKAIIGSFHAVKVIYRNKFKDPSPFEREFRGIEKFTPISRSHPGFVNVLHVGRNLEQGYFYYIMELGDDQRAGQKIDPAAYTAETLLTRYRRAGRLLPEECLEIALNLCSALQHLHEHQLIHRDIKPSNIIFVNGISKFADIGLVTEMDRGGVSDTTYVGTEGYIAPEGPGTAAADVYSLGKLLYEISTGLDLKKFPELPTQLMNGTEAPLFFRLNKIVLKACEDKPSRRFQSAAEMHGELVKLQEAAPQLT